MTDIFLDNANASGTVAGVFEADDETSYFYLYEVEPVSRIVASLHVYSGVPDFAVADVDIQWNDNESKVGLFIRGRLWAVFDITIGRGFAGRYPTAPTTWFGP